ncbi:MAG: ABC transporter permease [Chitinophagaceae bacterium]|nr:ABC transporter permease [Chitinophagaceae bacterium]
MVKNYLRTTFRILWKNRIYSFLNLSGLAIGIACAAAIFLWVEDETGFNGNFAKHDFLYRVMHSAENEGRISTGASTPGPMAEAIKAEIPGIRNAGRLSWTMDELLAFGEKSIKAEGVYADPAILSMFALPFTSGGSDSAFKQLQSVVICESLSKKIFGDENPVGKVVKMNINGSYSVDGLFAVTGVYRDFPENSSYKFQWISPYVVFENKNDWIKPWSNNLTETLVELEPAASVAAIDKKLEHYLGTKIPGNTSTCSLFSMNDWNLRNQFENGKIAGGKIKYVHLFSWIAFIILLIACINFMNLATARSEERAKEVGIHKVMGAGRRRLVIRFIGESLFMSFLAVLLALAILYLLMPSYNALVKKDLSVNLFASSHLLPLIGIAVFTGVIAGSYPAFYLSSFNPIRVLKGMRTKTAAGVVFIRKGLVIAQFTVSIILIISTIIIYQQVQHIKTRDIGYGKDNLVTMNLEGTMKKHFSSIKNKLMASGYVENAAVSLHDALNVYSSGSSYFWQGKDPGNTTTVHSNVVSNEYLSTMHMQIVSGRNFYPAGPDTATTIINESMAKLMGNAGKLGTVITNGRFRMEVVGIMKDFVYNDMYGSSQPLILLCYKGPETLLTIRYKSNTDLTKALASTAAIMKEENPGYPFEYKFVDEAFGQFFTTETLIGKLAGIFAVLAIFISCLGLFGLAAYTAERRTKEIGIRKVLGASVQALTGLLSKEFLQLVALSCILAFPVAWLALHSWLQDFQYRITIQPWVFAAGGITALFIALLTVSFQAVRAAMANPVKTLRSE